MRCPVVVAIVLGAALVSGCGDDDSDVGSGPTTTEATAVAQEVLEGFSFTPPPGWDVESRESEHGRGIVMTSPETRPDLPELPNEAFAFVPSETFDSATSYVETRLDLGSVSSRVTEADVAGAASAARVAVEGDLEDGTTIVTDYLIAVRDDGTTIELSCYGVKDRRNESRCEQLFDSLSL
jgi:hypothetical protein